MEKVSKVKECKHCGHRESVEVDMSEEELNTLADKGWEISVESNQTVITRYISCNACKED